MLKWTAAWIFLRRLVVMMTIGRRAGRTAGKARTVGITLSVGQKHGHGKECEYANPDSLHA